MIWGQADNREPAASRHKQPAQPGQAALPQTPRETPFPQDAEIERLVVADLEKHTQDRELVEMGLALKAADLLIGWAKVFGIFVAVPVSAVLALLTWLGVSKVEDIRKIVAETNETLASARGSAAQAEQAAKETQDILAAAQRSKADVDAQLANLQAGIEANQQRIQSLDAAVKEALKFMPGADLPDPLKDKIRRTVSNFRDYFARLDYNSASDVPNVTTQSHVHAIAYYDPGSNTIFVHPAYAESEYAVLRQYSHYILMSSRPKDDKWGDDPAVVALQYGLADYFPASFLGRSRLEALQTQQAFGDYVTDLDNQESLRPGIGSLAEVSLGQQAWGGLLWELRQKLGQSLADRCVFDSWRSLPGKLTGSISLSFVASLLGRARALAGSQGEEVLRDILLRRGLQHGQLPDEMLRAAAQ